MKNTLDFTIKFNSPDGDENGEDNTNPDSGGKGSESGDAT